MGARARSWACVYRPPSHGRVPTHPPSHKLHARRSAHVQTFCLACRKLDSLAFRATARNSPRRKRSHPAPACPADPARQLVFVLLSVLQPAHSPSPQTKPSHPATARRASEGASSRLPPTTASPTKTTTFWPWLVNSSTDVLITDLRHLHKGIAYHAYHVALNTDPVQAHMYLPTQAV